MLEQRKMLETILESNVINLILIALLFYFFVKDKFKQALQKKNAHLKKDLDEARANLAKSEEELKQAKIQIQQINEELDEFSNNNKRVNQQIKEQIRQRYEHEMNQIQEQHQRQVQIMQAGFEEKLKKQVLEEAIKIFQESVSSGDKSRNFDLQALKHLNLNFSKN